MARQLTLGDFSSPLEAKIEKTEQEPEEQSETVTRRSVRQAMKQALENKKYFLLSVDYDGKSGRAVSKLYDPESGELHVLYDTTGHTSYFLVDLEPEQINRNLKIVKDKSFKGLDIVSKVDPYTWKQIKLTKILVSDPLAVRRMREHVPRAYEAHIKYFNNYIYDFSLIPGMPYVVKKGRLVPLKPNVDVEEIKRAFSDADQITQEMALDWAPLFESEIPSVKRVAIDIEVYTPMMGRVPDPFKAEFPVISIALAGSDGLKGVLVLERDESVNNMKVDSLIRVETFSTERELLNRFFELVKSYPMVLTFNGDDFDVPYIIFRSLKLGILPEEIPFDVGENDSKYLFGFHVDLFRFFFNKAVRNYAFEGRYSEYNLDTVAQALLGQSKVKLESSISDLSASKLIEYNFRDSEITLKLTTFNNELVWKLIVLFSRISKLGIEELTRTEISAWVKNLYYWEHRKRNWLIPLKEEILERSSNLKTSAVIKGKGYKGAVVIDPPVGVFFNVVVLDFASLYPSIIRNWNLSYETVDVKDCKKFEDIKDESGQVLHKVCMDRPGITAVVTGLLRDFRVKIYKKKAKQKDLDEERKMLYDVVQRGMKVFINATYGVFGAETFPLYAPAVAESVTALGRFIITSTKNMAFQMGLKVVYGDTDSLFIHEPDRKKLEELVEWTRQNFGLDLEVDKTYRYIAFSGLKKNYFGVFTDSKVDIKGMLAKKRNTPEFLKQAFNEAKERLATVKTQEELEKAIEDLTNQVKEVYRKLKMKGYNLDELAFRVMLSKDVSSYKKNTPQHVKAAAQLRELNYQVLPRDIISFVKVKTKEGVKPVQLAKLSEVDVEKYYESVRSTFEQLLKSFNVSWDRIESTVSIDNYFKF
ncbi:DNA-directed DNA polymerase I [Metallosphaera tengchongensis]|uniref:DNA polymerase n=1 Tax=Metallosphaera tengchongensis TaxID=1532350 RepID=A0A6N0NRJ4_9CREN|nr:DNA-directed DNA polymerase I [Metallosphaera tengchongensis]QKQ99503.1 DNA-directed DNA polymerase I [Metallosphaera tengchongensis]